MLPSSALRNCTVVKYISFLPHLAQVCCVRASVLLSAAVKFWTADLFALSVEGKALALDSETIVLGTMSRLRAPQILQTMSFVGSPDDSSNKFPQSLQKIKDPIADILTSGG